MTRCRPRPRRRRRPADPPLDPTRPHPVAVHDGVPIAHEGPPGFPGRAHLADDEERGRR